MSNLNQFFGVIKSIQEGQIVISSGSSSNTATISSVTTSKSVCTFNGSRGNSTSGYVATVQLTNATTVTAARIGSPAADTTVGYTVTEYY